MYIFAKTTYKNVLPTQESECAKVCAKVRKKVISGKFPKKKMNLVSANFTGKAKSFHSHISFERNFQFLYL